MGDLVERLRHFGAKPATEHARGCIGSYIDLCNAAAGEIERQAALIEEAQEGFRAIVDGDVPRPLGQIYRQDKKRSKHDLCIHRVPMHDDCGNCTADFANTTLLGQA